MTTYSMLDQDAVETAFQLIEPMLTRGPKGLLPPNGCLLVFDPQITRYLPPLLSSDSLEKYWVEEGKEVHLPSRLSKSVLYRKDFGANWSINYTAIALSKGWVSWETRLPSHLATQQLPYLYTTNMTKYGGSAIDEAGRLIVVYSGAAWYIDKMVAEIMRDAIIGVCMDGFHHSQYGLMASDAHFVPDNNTPPIERGSN